MPRLTNKKITKKAAKDSAKRAGKQPSQAGMNRAFERAVNP